MSGTFASPKVTMRLDCFALATLSSVPLPSTSRLSAAMPRCVMTTVAQDDLPKDPGILRTAARHNDVNVGVYATVERPGRILRGDEVRVLPS